MSRLTTVIGLCQRYALKNNIPFPDNTSPLFNAAEYDGFYFETGFVYYAPLVNGVRKVVGIYSFKHAEFGGFKEEGFETGDAINFQGLGYTVIITLGEEQRLGVFYGTMSEHSLVVDDRFGNRLKTGDKTWFRDKVWKIIVVGGREIHFTR